MESDGELLIDRVSVGVWGLGIWVCEKGPWLDFSNPGHGFGPGIWGLGNPFSHISFLFLLTPQMIILQVPCESFAQFE